MSDEQSRDLTERFNADGSLRPLDLTLPDIVIDPYMPVGRFVMLTDEVLDQLQREGWVGEPTTEPGPPR